MTYTRRDFGRVVLAGVPAVALWSDRGLAQAAKPNSKWAGVQVGMNVPYSWGTGNFISVDEVIKRSIELGVNGLELRAQPIELELGSPAAKAGAAGAARRGGGGGGNRAAGGGREAAAPQGGRDAAAQGAAAGGRRGGGGGGGRAAQTPEQQAAARAAAEENRKWRTSVSLDRVRDVKRKFDNAGILVEIIKWDGLPAMADDELDYVFQVSKAMGAKALSAELSLELGKRIGPFADKHQLPFGFHGHAQGPELFEQIIAQAKYNWINLDIGHYFANHGSPIPFLKKHHARITHIHVKDRKANNGDTVPFGEGDTPVVEVLRLMRDNKWPFQATIEFEYSVPAGSDRITELKKSMEYCRRALVG
jgi:hypothetical protein